MLIGMSHGEIGHIRSSQQFFDQYLVAVPESPFRESLALLQAEYTYRVNPTDGYALLYNLYFHHQYPTTDVKIQEILGKPIEITTLLERSWRIHSFIKGNRLQEAWALYLEIQQKEELTDEETQWLADNLRNISWKTRQFKPYIELATTTYEEEPTSENAYKIFRAYCKDGQWENAANFGLESLNHFGRVGRWAGARDEIARSQMFAGQYDKSAELWGKMYGYQAKFYKGFSLYMNDQHTEAIAALTPLTKRKNGWDAASHYWIGRAMEQLEQDPSEHYRKAIELDSSHWYEILIRQRAQDSNTTSESMKHSNICFGGISRPMEHIGLWSEERRTHLPEVQGFDIHFISDCHQYLRSIFAKRHVSMGEVYHTGTQYRGFLNQSLAF